MGKTNLLDAIYYLGMCKSRVNHLDKYVLRHGAEFIRLEGLFGRLEKKEKIVAKVIPRKAKVLERNDVPYPKFSQHIGLIPVVIIMPDDTVMVREGSEERRRFMDNTLCQIDADYLKQLILYNKLLKQRNAVLKTPDGRVDYDLLAIYDQQMAPAAVSIHQKRKAFISDFLPVFQDWYSGISEDAETADMDYKSQLTEESYLELTKRSLQRDVIMKRSHVGIHKDDLIFRLSDNPMKRYASQGQLKSFVLSLGLARYGMLMEYKKIKPILLLDDIFDKLDQNRGQQLLKLLSENTFGQIFLTDTDEDRIKEIVGNFKRDFCIFKVEDGTVDLIEQK